MSKKAERTAFAEINKEKQLSEKRNYSVVKHNDMIRTIMFDLTTVEQKLIAYSIQKIMPSDTELKRCTFSLGEFCDICGISATNHTYYRGVIKKLADKSWWIEREDNKHSLMRWFDTCEYDSRRGEISLIFSQSLKPYLLLLKDNYTRYSLNFILPMRSAYSIRLYEYLRSYAFQKVDYIDKSLNELRKHTNSENHKEWTHFNNKVLIPAVKEINEYSDLKIEYQVLKTGRSVSHIRFFLQMKDYPESLYVVENNNNILDGVYERGKL